MPILAEIGADGWIAIVTAIGVAIANIVALVIGYLKVTRIEKVADATHTLVNSQHGVVLASNAALARWKAERSGTAGDSEAAVLAEKTLADHNSQQAKVDRGEATPLAPPDLTKPDPPSQWNP